MKLMKSIGAMLQHGLNNVWGGICTQVELTQQQIDSFEERVRGVLNQCYFCGEVGHMVAECPLRASARPPSLNTDLARLERNYFVDGDVCLRCGRPGHWADSCYARKDINGEDI
jgi:hypothetical protein